MQANRPLRLSFNCPSTSRRRMIRGPIYIDKIGSMRVAALRGVYIFLLIHSKTTKFIKYSIRSICVRWFYNSVPNSNSLWAFSRKRRTWFDDRERIFWNKSLYSASVFSTTGCWSIRCKHFPSCLTNRRAGRPNVNTCIYATNFLAQPNFFLYGYALLFRTCFTGYWIFQS